jgi:choline monooxygenase
MSGQGTHVYELASVAGIKLPRIKGWPEDRLRYAEYISLYPNTLLGLQADHLFSVIVLPRRSDNSLEKLQISYVGRAQHDETFAPCRSAVLKSWDSVFREDIFAVEGMQAGRNSPGFDGGVLTPLQDIPTRHFHAWVAGCYNAAIT